MELSKKINEEINKKIEEFSLNNLSNDDILFKTELKEIESGNLRNGLKHYNNDNNYSYYISDERSVILELQKGSRNEPWVFLIKKESIEIKKFFTKSFFSW